MALNLRDFLASLGDDLIRVDDEIDPITQAGALCSAAPRPIMLSRLKGFPGWSLCDILVKDRARQAKALGTTPKHVVRELSDRMFTRVPGGSKLVPDGPCKEVKLLGADADITKLPIPIHSEGDAGRYLGSGVTITRDPETGVRNEAIIRALVRGPRKMGFWMAARHNWAHLMKYQERGLPAPMAFAIGLHPGYEILANFSGRHEGYDELEMGAGVLGETLELVKCETIDLEVPAQAEIVIEGVVPPGVREPEGPFGEFTGYSKGAEGPAPVFEVTGITRRRDAIYRHMQATVFTDHQPLVSVPMEASLFRRLSEIHGRTEIHDVYIPPWVTMFTVFVQMTPRWDGQARDVLLGVLSSPYLHPKIAIAVDEDVEHLRPARALLGDLDAREPRAGRDHDPARAHPSARHLGAERRPVRSDGDARGRQDGDRRHQAALWRKKERDEFARIKPKGADDPGPAGAAGAPGRDGIALSSRRGSATRPAATPRALDLLQRTPGGEPDHPRGARAGSLNRIGRALRRAGGRSSDLAADFTPGTDGPAGGAHREPSEIAADLLGGADRSANGAERGRAELGADFLNTAHRGDDRLGQRVNETDRQRFRAPERRAQGLRHAGVVENPGAREPTWRLYACDSWLVLASAENPLWHLVR